MKTFKQFINEEVKSLGDNPKFKEMRKRDQDFYKQSFGSEAPKSLNDTRPVDFTGSRHSDGKTVSVIPDKPIVGKDDAVGKLLASKGYSRSGEKMRATSYPDVRRARAGMATDTKFKLGNITKKINTPSINQSEPTKVQPKVGSLAVKQTGYPAAKKPSLAPHESQRASSGGSYKIQPGDNPSKIAKNLGMSLQDLEQKNPGILKRAKRLKIGGTINR